MLKRIIYITAILWSTGTLMAQDVLLNSMHRNTVSLNGEWKYIVDPYETGYANFHGEIYDQKNSGATAAYYNNYKAKNKTELVEYDFDQSPSMQIPGDWNTQKENLLYYEGTIWLKKNFDYLLPENKKLFLYFAAVNYKAEVYLNGQKLGMHEGGFTPFQFDITAVVREKNNYLVVKADNKRNKEGLPALNTDWWNYGGITREVLLIQEPEIYIQKYAIQLNRNNSKNITATVHLKNTNNPEWVNLTIPELHISEKAQTINGVANFNFNAPDDIKYWSPQQPKRYEVQVKTQFQTLEDQIGFRTITTNGTNLLLNGKSIYLRGISMHEEINGHRVTNQQEAIQLLQIAKDLGCNYVRLAHYPHSEQMVLSAEALGLLIWEEIPVYWSVDFQHKHTYDLAAAQMTAVVERDKNRAAVIIWSVANETPLVENRNNFLKQLIQLTRSLDDTRLISAALLTRMENGIGRIDDSIGNFLDVIAFNEYQGWYGGDLAKTPGIIWQSLFNKPILVSEFGGDAKFGLHGEKMERWTEEYQDYLYRQNLQMIENISGCSGMSPWILMDFRSPRRVLPKIQDGFNRKGLVSEKGEKKKAFFTLKQFYQKIKDTKK